MNPIYSTAFVEKMVFWIFLVLKNDLKKHKGHNHATGSSSDSATLKCNSYNKRLPRSVVYITIWFQLCFFFLLVYSPSILSHFQWRSSLALPFRVCFALAFLYYLIFMICATPCIVSFDKYFKTHQGAAELWFICQQPTREQFSKPLKTLCERARTHCHNILFQLPCVHKNCALEWPTSMRANIFSIASIFHGQLDT